MANSLKNNKAAIVDKQSLISKYMSQPFAYTLWCNLTTESLAFVISTQVITFTRKHNKTYMGNKD